jgi:hypothetical protein
MVPACVVRTFSTHCPPVKARLCLPHFRQRDIEVFSTANGTTPAFGYASETGAWPAPAGRRRSLWRNPLLSWVAGAQLGARRNRDRSCRVFRRDQLPGQRQSFEWLDSGQTFGNRCNPRPPKHNCFVGNSNATPIRPGPRNLVTPEEIARWKRLEPVSAPATARRVKAARQSGANRNELGRRATRSWRTLPPASRRASRPARALAGSSEPAICSAKIHEGRAGYRWLGMPRKPRPNDAMRFFGLFLEVPDTLQKTIQLPGILVPAS